MTAQRTKYGRGNAGVAAFNGTYAPLLETVYVQGTAGTAQTINLANGSIQDFTASAASCAFTMPTAVAGQSFVWRFHQDGTGGRAVTWVGTIEWPGGAAPTLTPTASAKDVVSFTCITAGTWEGFPAGYDMR
ncbi:MAG: hypothetical protein WB777_14240 [Mycobacterium sp.]